MYNTLRGPGNPTMQYRQVYPGAGVYRWFPKNNINHTMPSPGPSPSPSENQNQNQHQQHRQNNHGSQSPLLGNTENIKFVAWELLKLTGILVAGGIALGIPAHMLTNNPKISKEIKSRGDEVRKVRMALMSQPIKTAAWWAGGSSVLIGAKDNKPKQMAAGAGLMAYSSMIESK